MRPFDDQSVQDDIRERLRQQQYSVLYNQALEKMFRSAAISPDPPLLDTAVDMAMQEYPRWAAR